VCPPPNPPQCWPHQALSPIYGWNNTINGSPSLIGVAGSYLFQSSIIQEDREFYNCTIGAPKTGCLAGTIGSPSGSPTPKANYTPYTYPHPLAAFQVPEAPTNLTILP
jgi:hypothetical protein